MPRKPESKPETDHAEATPKTVPEPGTNQPAMLTGWAPASLLGGLLWAQVGLFRGAGLKDFGLLVLGASLSLWILLNAWEMVRAQEQLGRRALLSAGLVWGLCVTVGIPLLSRTHHRGLGAVTLVCLVGVAGIGALLTLGRWPIPRATMLPLRWGAALALGYAVSQSGPGSRELAIEVVAGAGALIVARLGQRQLTKASWAPTFGRLVLSVQMCCWLSALAIPGTTQAARRLAPAVAGLVGLGA